MRGVELQRRGVPRREFLRGGVMVAVAVGAAGPALIGAATGPVEARTTGSALGSVSGLARSPRGIVAVGDAAGAPRVWRRRDGARTWQEVADETDFPPGTVLADVDAVGEHLVAVGHVAGGPAPSPAAFASPDGQTWSRLALPTQVPSVGTATGVAGRGGRFLVVGSGFESAEVLEPAGSFAAQVEVDGQATSNGGPPLPGLRHGAITMLEALDGGLIAGATGVGGVLLAIAPGGEGPWTDIAPPPVAGPASPAAAATVDGATVLTMIDGLDRSSWWRRTPRGWSQIQPVGGLAHDAKVAALLGGRARVTVAGAARHGSFVEEVAA